MCSGVSNLDNKNTVKLPSSSRTALFDGWFPSAKKIPSPNFNQRPDSADVSLLVIHNISLPPEQFGNGCIEAFFCNRLDKHHHPYFKTIAKLEVSSHFLITRKGELVQFVSTEQRAWHAGKSRFEARDNCNDFSIGVELEGADTLPYSAEQYDSVASLIQHLMEAYPRITKDRIVGHSDISPGRKTDPGPAFNWQKIRGMIK